MRKKVLIIIVILLLATTLFSLFFFLNKEEDKSISDLLKEEGYSNDEVSLILDKVAEEDYEDVLNLGYDKSLLGILSASGYDESKFNNYIEYYVKNKDANINNIITIINSGYDLDNYPASSLLADLVKEKYYINDNEARY